MDSTSYPGDDLKQDGEEKEEEEEEEHNPTNSSTTSRSFERFEKEDEGIQQHLTSSSWSATRRSGVFGNQREEYITNKCTQISFVLNLLLFILVGIILHRVSTLEATISIPEPTSIQVNQDSECSSISNPSSMTCPGVCSQFNTTKKRARDLGIPFEGFPGPFNAITDIPGVLVGHSTLICGEPGPNSIRTGVTAILPRGVGGDCVNAAFYSLSGNGEFTGSHWIQESGTAAGPIMTTNTISVGTVHQAVSSFSIPLMERYPNFYYELPHIGETDDGYLNDIEGMHVKPEHVFQALECAKSGFVAEGNVGGGTGMMTFDFKAGIGTASRMVEDENGKNWTVGVLVQTNHGDRLDMMVAGTPVGKEITDWMPEEGEELEEGEDKQEAEEMKKKKKQIRGTLDRKHKEGSFLCIIGTNAPLTSTNLQRIAKRAVIGYGRAGGMGRTASGDLFLTFSTGGKCFLENDVPRNTHLYDMELNPFIYGAIQAVEEAMINALVAAETMTGRDGTIVYALPQDRLIQVLKKYNRWNGNKSTS